MANMPDPIKIKPQHVQLFSGALLNMFNYKLASRDDKSDTLRTGDKIIKIWYTGTVLPQGKDVNGAKEDILYLKDFTNRLANSLKLLGLCYDGITQRIVSSLKFNGKEIPKLLEGLEDCGHKEFSARLEKLFNLMGLLVRRYEPKVKDAPDMVMISPFSLPPYVIFVELKTGKGTLSKDVVTQVLSSREWLEGNLKIFPQRCLVITSKNKLERAAETIARNNGVRVLGTDELKFLISLWEKRPDCHLLFTLLSPSKTPWIKTEEIKKIVGF